MVHSHKNARTRREPLSNRRRLAGTILHYYRTLKKRTPLKRLRRSYFRWSSPQDTRSTQESFASNHMSTHRSHAPRTAQWSDEHEIVFLEKMIRYANDNNGKNIDKNTWCQWAAEFQERFGFIVTMGQLTSKRDRFRRYYDCYNALLKETGLGWNPEDRTIACSNERWRSFEQKYKCANVIKRDGLRHSELVHELFGRSDATGSRAVSSGSRRSRQQMTQDDDVDDEGATMSDEYFRRAEGRAGSSARGGQRKNRRRDSADAAIQEMADTFKTYVTQPQQRPADPHREIVAGWMPYLLELGLPDDVCLRAAEILQRDPSTASVFVELPPNLRMGWISLQLGHRGIHVPEASHRPPQTAPPAPASIAHVHERPGLRDPNFTYQPSQQPPYDGPHGPGFPFM